MIPRSTADLRHDGSLREQLCNVLDTLVVIQMDLIDNNGEPQLSALNEKKFREICISLASAIRAIKALSADADSALRLTGAQPGSNPLMRPAAPIEAVAAPRTPTTKGRSRSTLG